VADLGGTNIRAAQIDSGVLKRKTIPCLFSGTKEERLA